MINTEKGANYKMTFIVEYEQSAFQIEERDLKKFILDWQCDSRINIG